MQDRIQSSLFAVCKRDGLFIAQFAWLFSNVFFKVMSFQFSENNLLLLMDSRGLF